LTSNLQIKTLALKSAYIPSQIPKYEFQTASNCVRGVHIRVVHM